MEPRENFEKAKEEFLEAAPYFLFFASFEPVITPFGLSQKVAENVEKDAFLQSRTQEMYTMRLAEWLANVFRSTGSDVGSELTDNSHVEDFD